jgi:cobalt-precorrin-5B (C1)-methyltransferase
MILLFGGTTEGLAAARLLNLLDFEYLYSTKTPTRQVVDGEHITGALDTPAMVELCRQRAINLIIDASHPFAENLHQNISDAANQLNINIIRFNREEVDLSSFGVIRYFPSFEAMKDELQSSYYQRILALTGVQTIRHFLSLMSAKTIHFRILDTAISSQIAMKTGIDMEMVHPAPAHITEESLQILVNQTTPEVLLTKDSGESGYLSLKAQVAHNHQLPLWVVQRPALPTYTEVITSVKALNQSLLRFRKEVLKDNHNLRKGYTTGSCTSAAAKASLQAIINQRFDNEVTIQLPTGEAVAMRVYPQTLTITTASCTVIKDAGDDPDVTHACEIGCSVEINQSGNYTFHQGEGVGRVTLPGLQVEVGEPAINPTPRQMMVQMAQSVLNEYDIEAGVRFTPFIPQGKMLAQKTFNPRIGIEGGLSIIGTSGRVMPYSDEAFINALRQQISIAQHTSCRQLVATSGRRSELLLQKDLPDLPLQAFVHHGNMVGETLQIAVEKGFTAITLGIMLGKAIKLAEGNLNTHSSKITFNAQFAAQLASVNNIDSERCESIGQLKLANAITAIIPFTENEPFYIAIARHCWEVCQTVLPEQTQLSLVLLCEDQKIVWGNTRQT